MHKVQHRLGLTLEAVYAIIDTNFHGGDHIMPIASKITRYLAFDPQLSPLYHDQTIGPGGKLGGKARGSYLLSKFYAGVTTLCLTA